jgi:hypothetical protein
MSRERRLLDKIERTLRDEGLSYEREPSIGGLRPDFLVRGPRGELVVVEGKAWPSIGGNTARALEQVNRYKSATGADFALIVLDQLKRNYRQRGVINAEALANVLAEYFGRSKGPKKQTKAKQQPADRTVFAAMPFDRKYDDTFFVAMSYAAERVSATCKRVDKTEFTGDIVAEIRRLIRESAAVIADLSDSKPNVLYEAGYAHALEKPTVHICSTPMSELPFDVRNWNAIKYTIGQTSNLKAPLVRRLKSVMK